MTLSYNVEDVSTAVSIHTPTKGVTPGGGSDGEDGLVSIHTPTKGVTAAQDSNAAYAMFQSTHPRRV